MPNSGVYEESSVYNYRRENLKRILQEKGAKTYLAARLGCTQAVVSQWLRDPTANSARIIHEGAARGIEQALNLEPMSLDKPPNGVDFTNVLKPLLKPPTGQPVLHVALPAKPQATDSNNEKVVAAMLLEMVEKASTLDEAKRFAGAARGLLNLGN